MRVLAIDCSTEWLSVAAGDETRCVERREHAGQAHSQLALPRIRAVLDECGWGIRDLDGIAFGAGPGSFTGVRIACGIAQGLALGSGVGVVPVGTLEALAQEAWRAHAATSVVACLDARMREVYVAGYERDDDAWRVVAPPAVTRPDAATAIPRAFGAGDGFASYPALAGRLGIARFDATLRPTARAIGELAAPRVRRGEVVAARDAQPLYVRHRVALTASERAGGARL